jgi:hypothetical protein
LNSKVDFDTVKANAIYVSTAISSGSQYDDYYKFNLPTLMVAYQTPQEATSVAETLPLGTTYYVVNNLLIFSPKEAFIDTDFAVEAYNEAQTRITADDLKLKGQALMTINLQAMVDNLAHVEQEEDAAFIKEFGNVFGFNENSYWSGMSPDGITWEGKFHNLDKLPTTADVSEYFNSAVRAIDVNGDEVKMEEISEEEYGGFIDPNQAYALQAFSIRTNEFSLGSNTTDGSYPGVVPPVLPEEEGVYQIKMNTNDFLSYMQNRHMTYPLTNSGTITITVKDASGKSTIKFQTIEEAVAEDAERIQKMIQESEANRGVDETATDMTDEEMQEYGKGE